MKLSVIATKFGIPVQYFKKLKLKNASGIHGISIPFGKNSQRLETLCEPLV